MKQNIPDPVLGSIAFGSGSAHIYSKADVEPATKPTNYAIAPAVVPATKQDQTCTAALVNLFEGLVRFDPEAAKQLITRRVPVKSGLDAKLSGACIDMKNDKPTSSVLGLCNHLAYAESMKIQALYDETGNLIGFRSIQL